jgi:dipeptidyl aminopeptidase/acylaminoacyl peptidase
MKPTIVRTVLVAWAALSSAPLAAQTVDYQRAERFLSWNASDLIAGDNVNPNWIGGTDRFWYRNKTGGGFEFLIVDAARGTQAPLFDHARLASALTLAADTAYDAHKLPFSSFSFVGGEGAITFRIGKKQFECNIRAYACATRDTLPGVSWAAVSPDSAWEAFVIDYDLYVRRRGGRDTIRLTTDGEQYNSYGVNAPRAQAQMRRDTRQRPTVAWSPDSRRLAVMRTDERKVEHSHFVSYTSQRPRHFSQPYALPGDSIIPISSIHILDLAETLAAAEQDGDAKPPAPRNTRVEIQPVPFRLQMGGSSVDSTWSSSSDRVYATAYTRGAKKLFLIEIDASTGAQRILAGDSAKTNVIGQEYIESKSWYVTRDFNDVIWWSERDGWAHLWRYDRDGNVRNQITSGAWNVGVIQRVDETNRHVYFIGRGRESGATPYYARLYRVNYDGSGLTLLTPEDANHEIEFSPSGRFFVDTYSRIDKPPVTVLRRAADGAVVRTLQEADISRLVEMGWRPAETFVAKGRDNITDVYGVIYFPPNLDPSRKYPIIENIYPGPFVGSVGGWSFKGHGETFALAQLGFVVVQVDHIGTRHRGKAFHDNYYGNMGDNGLPDHIAALKQLAARYPFMDLDRVGIFGHSGGGFASTDAVLRFPEFYKVAVSGAGNHDQLTYGHYWGEVYQGLVERDTLRKTTNYDNQANRLIAKNLQGKLLLMHGDMDDNVHPAMTIQVVDELIKANKDFDLIIAPDRAHGLNEPYFIRRRWDYFVRHLMGVEPPKEYRITRPAGGGGGG